MIARLIALFIILPVELNAQIIFSEVLYNEPGNQTSLEWIEIYNRSDTPIDLAGIILISGADTSRFHSGSMVQSFGYAVLARVLTSENGASFESHWGDSSGFWGDYTLEDYPAYDITISLPNDNGQAELVDTLGNLIDTYSWNEPVSDGFSMERDDLESSQSAWHECTDPDGSTPGKANSPKISGNNGNSFAASVEPRLISRSSLDGSELFQITAIKSDQSKLTVEIFDDTARKIRTIAENESGKIIQLTWDGRGEDGNRLAPGIYIVVFSGAGNKSIPVVIAP